MRARAALATAGSTPWRRAPWLLWRRPGVLLATAGAAMVLAASLASVPLFLSSAGTEAVALQAGERCPRDTGATYRNPPGPGSRLDAPDPFAPLADQLGPSVLWGRIETTLQGDDPARRTPVVVLFRDGATGHVDVVEGAPRPAGVWLSDRAVAMTGASPDAVVDLGGIPTPVAGVYRDLAAGTVTDPFWCAHRPDLLLRGADLVPPRPVVIVDRETWSRLEGSLDSPVIGTAWEAPLRADLTVTQASDLVDELACAGPHASALTWCVGAPTTTFDEGTGEGTDPAAFVTSRFDTSLPFVVERSRGIQVAVGGGVWPVAVLAALAAMGLVAATALLWCDRRQREVTLLTARGMSPGALAGKAVLELLGALVIGTGAGVAVAYGLVVSVGPSPTVEPSAIGRAGWMGVLAVVLSAAVVATVVAIRVQDGPSGRRRRWLRLVPWEVGLGLAAAFSLRRLDAWGMPVARGAIVSHVDVVGLMFPVLFLATAVAVAARVLVIALRPLRAISRDWPSALFLAIRRVDRYRVAVIAMVAAAALATGVLGYAATIERSMDATLKAKALVYLGSDVVVRVPQDVPVPAGLAGRSTSVDLYQHAWVETGQRGVALRQQVNVFAIDPATFAQASFWDASLASSSLEEIVGRLGRPSDGGRIPVLVVGFDLPAVADAGIVSTGTTRFEVAEVAEVQAFPGMRRGSPALFVAASSLQELGLETRVREIRVRGERDDILRILDEVGTDYQEVTTADGVVDAISFLTVTQTFGFMRSLAMGSVLLVVGGVAVYLDARRRSRVLGYGFARRMGLTKGQHGRALWVEVLAGVGVGCWLGVFVALAAAGLAIERLDPLPLVPPDPVLRPASVLLVGVGVASFVVAAVAAAIAQRRTDRDDPLEVLRGGT